MNQKYCRYVSTWKAMATPVPIIREKFCDRSHLLLSSKHPFNPIRLDVMTDTDWPGCICFPPGASQWRPDTLTSSQAGAAPTPRKTENIILAPTGAQDVVQTCVSDIIKKKFQQHSKESRGVLGQACKKTGKQVSKHLRGIQSEPCPVGAFL